VLLGLGVGLALAAMANLVVEAVPPDVTGVASAINAIMRTIGGAVGAQVAAAIVSGALSENARFPAESGFTGAFTMSALASGVALLVCFAIPSRSAVRARTRVTEATEATRA
jgi:MFS family permease